VFWGCGMIGVVYALVLILFLREIPRGRATGSTEIGASARVQWQGFAILLLVFSLPSIPGWAVKNWLPTLLQDRLMLDQKSAGLWATMVYASAAFCGVICGGLLSDRWIRRSVRGRAFASGAGLLLTAPALVGIGLAPGFAVTILCSALFGFGWGIFDANNMPILCQISPPSFRATGYGLMNFIGISAGAYVTPLLGQRKDSGVTLADSFAMCAIPALVAAGLVFLMRPKGSTAC